MSDLTKEIDKYLDGYKCEHHTVPNMENPHGCTDCYNTGLILDSEESGLIFESYKEIHKLESQLTQETKRREEAERVMSQAFDAIRFELGELKENEHSAFDWVRKCLLPYNEKYRGGE